ncbi:MAG: histidine kinase [Bacteroidota bacterium]
MVFRLLILLFFLSIRVYCSSQQYQEKNFKHLTTIDGLSNNNISGIEQDSNGYIWVSTSRGLNRFDGTLFKQFLHTGGVNSLPDNKIFSLRLLQNDQLVAATEEGVQLINTKTLARKNIYISGEEALRYWTNSCRYVNTDGAGNLGISTKTGFYIFSPDGKLKNRYDRYKAEDAGHQWMSFGKHLYQVPDGNMIQVNFLGILVYNSSKNLISNALDYYPGLKQLFRITEKSQDIFFFIAPYKILLLNTGSRSFDLFDIRTGKIRSVPVDLDLSNEVGWQTRVVHIRDNIWAFNSKFKGFFLLEISNENNQVKLIPGRQLSEQLCTTIFMDSYQRLWIGTDEGLFMQDTRKPIIKTVTLKSNELNKKLSIKCLYVSDKLVFAGTEQNDVLILDKKTNQLLSTLSLPVRGSTTSFIRIHPDTLWVTASLSGLYWINMKNFSFGKAFPDIFNSYRYPFKFFPDKNGKIWISTLVTNEVFCYDVASHKIDSLTKKSDPLLNINLVSSFAQDKYGNIYLGGDGIARWNRKLKRIDTLIKHIAVQKNNKEGFVIMGDTNGDIWTIVNDGGFANITSPQMIYIEPENIGKDFGPSAYPSIIENRIFTPTNSGVGFLNIKELKGVIFNTDDGIPQQSISTYDFYLDSADKSIWFACRNVLCVIPFLQNDYYFTPPSLMISELAVINDSIINYPPQKVSLKYFQNDVNLSLSAINYSDPKNMRFAYRFVNKKDSSWISMGTQQNILLTNISPGTYDLQVKAYAYDNKWPEQIKEIHIHINSPFWKTTWFFLLITLFIIAITYYLYHRRVDQIQQKANLDKLLAQTEMKALHSQMNPHFIFNCLNSIREMILNNENNQASLYLSKFARLIRITLNHSSKTFVSLDDTIDYLQRYIEMEQIRTNNFSYSFEVDKTLQPDEIFLPPMLIQPFIENAIWHGAIPGKEMHVSIYFKRNQSGLICIIEDNGIGIEASIKNKEQQVNYQSVGISNVRQRMQVLNEKYNLQSAVEIEDKSRLFSKGETGTIVTLHLTIKNSETLQ